MVASQKPWHIFLPFAPTQSSGWLQCRDARNGSGMRTRLDPVGDIPCRTIAISFLSPPSWEGQLLTGAIPWECYGKQR
ncbi:hypothetical protein PpBr36_07149 [Pyricularia pennisetigena]|uniref:hypothetical protein n=1 Tax=Pyricularia pennisetigena TaxID=1578925 RepID=UPI001152373C|nr:hypothetical protein PpBr36_07149 [Pyricularia pennisetigena]TLS26022.1 hypothetical protein PpBr36_07149 [Pyricularia pennisetigena]